MFIKTQDDILLISCGFQGFQFSILIAVATGFINRVIGCSYPIHYLKYGLFICSRKCKADLVQGCPLCSPKPKFYSEAPSPLLFPGLSNRSLAGSLLVACFPEAIIKWPIYRQSRVIFEIYVGKTIVASVLENHFRCYPERIRFQTGIS